VDGENEQQRNTLKQRETENGVENGGCGWRK